MMSTKWQPLHIKLCVIVALLGLRCHCASAQQEPKQPDQPVDATEYEPPTKALGLVRGGGPGPNAIPPNTYYSPCLGGHFRCEFMQLTINGQRFLFWGARAMSLERHSPLQALGLRVGDVVTRLDGLRISDNFFTDANTQVIQLPELERHYGATDVRWISRGHHHVNVGQIVINPPPQQPNNTAFVPVEP